MRIAGLATLAVTWLLIGGTCLPIQPHKHEAVPGEVLGISVSTLAQDQTLPEGTPVTINWAAANLTGEPATVSITLESRTDLSRVVLLEGQTFAGTSSGSRSFAWNTEGFGGPYSVIADITTSTLTRESKSGGLVTIDARPKFEFTEPVGDVTFEPAKGPLTIAWIGSDESASVRIGVDTDTDHTSGNEFTLFETELPTQAAPDSFDWDGLDDQLDQVPAGTYNLFAIATDDVNPVVVVDGLGQITVVR